MAQQKRKKGEAPDPALTNEMLRRAALGGAVEMGNPVYDGAQMLGSALAAPHLRAIAEHDARQAAQAGYVPVPSRALQPNYHPPKNWAEHAMDVMNPVTDAAQQMMANPADVFDIRRPGVPEGQMGYLGALGAGLAQPPMMPKGLKVPRAAVPAAPGISPAGANTLAARMATPPAPRPLPQGRPPVPMDRSAWQGRQQIDPTFAPTGKAADLASPMARLGKVEAPQFNSAWYDSAISLFQKAIRRGDVARARIHLDHAERRHTNRATATPQDDAIYDYMINVMDGRVPATRQAPGVVAPRNNAPALGGNLAQQPAAKPVNALIEPVRGGAPLDPHFTPTGNVRGVQFHNIRLGDIPQPQLGHNYHNERLAQFNEAVKNNRMTEATRLLNAAERATTHNFTFGNPESDRALYNYMYEVMNHESPRVTRQPPGVRSPRTDAPTLGGERVQNPDPYAPTIGRRQ